MEPSDFLSWRKEGGNRVPRFLEVAGREIFYILHRAGALLGSIGRPVFLQGKGPLHWRGDVLNGKLGTRGAHGSPRGLH